MAEALGRLSVVELCDDLPGACCARQFAAWGADVVVVEPPEGSPLRWAEPLARGRDGTAISLLWEYVGAGKQTRTVDRTDATALRGLQSLLRAADVVVTDWEPQRLAAAGLDSATLRAAAPRLVVVSITPFGADGPYSSYAGSDLVVQALPGLLSLSGAPDRAPLKVAANIIPYACGVSAFIGALAALRERQNSGSGQLVEIACLEAAASLVLFLRAQYAGEPFPRRLGVGTVLLPCRDGCVLANPQVQTVWDALLGTLGVDADAVPEQLRTLEG
ncbi:MAG TPA: CoA transferase, partial [Steroidobacteraceae bacterium]|nr:CoA transferase [Steroidobacteraceae bacterium]